MVDKMVVLELVALAVVLFSPCVRVQKSAQDITPYETFSCYTDHCNVDKREFCSDREKRCISCFQHMGDCQNPEKAPRMPRECIINCRRHLHEKEVRQQYEEQMEKDAQACKDKIEEMQQNIYTNWLVILVGIVAALGWGILICMWVRSCRKKSSSRRGKRQGTSPATRGNSEDEECCVEMTGQSNGDLKARDDMSSGFGSKSTALTMSKDSAMGELRIESETARQAVPISAVWTSPEDMEHDFLSDLNNLVEKGENGSQQPQSQGHHLRRGQHPMRQQGQRDQQHEEEEQRLLGQQQGDEDQQQQQQQQRLFDQYGPQSPPDSGADMGETRENTDVCQPQRPYQHRRGVPPESDSSIHRSSTGHGASSGCLANAGPSLQASGRCQSPPACSPTTTCKAYEKLTQVNPTNNT